ncbi:MAG: molybdopterin converting factor small subunit [Cyclobacteriaceae bacterium]|jgi:molybdopterin converting factor small subunit
MARVVFSSEQQRLTKEAECDVVANTYRQLIDAVITRYPRLDRGDFMRMAIAIDGEIIHEPLLETVGDNSEVHFFHFIAGG